MSQVFAPGCALMIYKPELGTRLLEYLNDGPDRIAEHLTCGDSFYGTLPVEKVKDQMRRRAGEMPCQDVVVYCVSCSKAMHIGGKRPRYIVDLLFGEPTAIGTFEPDAWHGEIQAFIDAH